MKIVKRSSRTAPKVSLILVDWSVRESFHLLHYLSKQNVDRNKFEVIVVEFYSRESEAVRKYEEQVDSWMILQMPDDCYYHKHLMYNAGIVLSKGEIVVICDSDAMVKETFISSIIDEFEKDPSIVLHMDQFRNVSRDFYPFNYTSFDEVTGKGCINNVGGKTKGLVDIKNPIHTKNYGACMAAKRDDLISIGGADEHIDYMGHICGPYEMTFRLINHGRREVWHQTEFIYHTWHPGQAGMDNYLGPHDGMHMSTIALDSLVSGRVTPYVENQTVRNIRSGKEAGGSYPGMLLTDTGRPKIWRVGAADETAALEDSYSQYCYLDTHNGFRIEQNKNSFRAALLSDLQESTVNEDGNVWLNAATMSKIKTVIDKTMPAYLTLILRFGILYTLVYRVIEESYNHTIGHLNRLRGREKGGASPLSVTSNQSIKIKVVGRIKQYLTDIKLHADSMNSIIVNLYFMKNKRLSSSGNTDSVLLLHNSWQKYHYSILATLAVLPKIKIVIIMDAETLDKFLNNVEKHGWNVNLFVSKKLFFRFHGLMASYKVRTLASVY